MLSEKLVEIAEPEVRKVQQHPFWAGLRDGSLPAVCLLHFVQQDTGYLLPAFARAMARTAAMADRDTHAMLLTHGALASLEAKDRLRAAFDQLAPDLGIAPLGAAAPVDPATHAYSSFFVAASAVSFAAGLGALLPMVWFNLRIPDDLMARRSAGSRYNPWLDAYHPGEKFGYAVRGFLSMVDEVGKVCSAADRELIAEQFSLSTRYELAFAEGCWSRASWTP